MKLLATVRLYPSAQQAERLARTYETWNAARQYFCTLAHTHDTASKVTLQRMGYAHARSSFGLPAHLVVSAISSAAEAYKRSRPQRPPSHPVAVLQNPKTLSWHGTSVASVLTLEGREAIPCTIVGYKRASPDHATGMGWLQPISGGWTILIVISLPKEATYALDI